MGRGKNVTYKNALKHCSPLQTRKGLISLRKNSFIEKKLINPNNIYLTNSANLVAKHGHRKNTWPLYAKTDIAKYVGASKIAHCYDGWNYLARGVEALFNGDVESCIHYAYYSELRSVMSIMANIGIGIFKNKHVYFDSGKSIKTFGGPTHQVADALINKWTKYGKEVDEFFKSIKIYSYTLNDLFYNSELSSTGVYTREIISEWLKSWSFDFQLHKDQDIRNESSYRPHFYNNKLDYINSISIIKDFWKVLEPSATSPFSLLDSHLARIALEKLYILSTGKKIGTPEYKVKIENIFSKLGESENRHFIKFILRESEPNDLLIFSEAKKDSKRGARKENFINPSPILARTILLARVATGMVKITLEDTSIEPQMIRFYRDNNARQVGIISDPTLLSESKDLYADISDSFSEMDSVLLKRPSTYNIIMDNASMVNTMKQFQRACLWGMDI